MTKQGKEQEYLVIPETIEGLKVAMLGIQYTNEVEAIELKYGDSSYAHFQSEKLKKVFMPPDVGLMPWGWYDTICFDNAPNLQGLIHLGISECDNEEGYCCWRNVSYLYNYEGAKDKGFYWRDDCKDETIQYIPENPIREGYTFGGWYKEAECINEWNFQTDIVPKKSEENIYSSTNLYAKWIEN